MLYVDESESRGSAGAAASTDRPKARSNSGDEQSTVNQESPASTEALRSTTPRHAVRFAEQSPPPPAPLEVTAGVDVHQTPGVSAAPPDSAKDVGAVDTLEQSGTAGAPRSVTARLISTPGEPRSVAV